MGAGGKHLNFIGQEDLADEAVRAAYPAATYDRLARAKARYDPANLFRLNHNIKPAV
ncbi:BBE domain-containing protein [Actinoplanes sp. NPDC020271]|uniref:BBE domain-containing protein n=1 Tax=Actinoplanes sp. NPDC020271 TaxID=3363896 RepID=UPI0037B19B3B